jgi:hypothetical protein
VSPILIGLLPLAGAEVAAGAGAPQADKTLNNITISKNKFTFLSNMDSSPFLLHEYGLSKRTVCLRYVFSPFTSFTKQSASE